MVPLAGHLPAVTESVGILLLLKAFASGCSALTGVEAIANAVPEFRKPRARRAQHTEMWLGILLGLMLIGIAMLIRKFHVAPSATETTLAQLAAAAVGQERRLLRHPADHHRAAGAGREHLVRRPAGPGLPAGQGQLPAAPVPRCAPTGRCTGTASSCWRSWPRSCWSWPRGDTQALIPVFAIGVFVGFTLSQAGMVRHWREQRGDGWVGRAFINGLGAVLTTAALAIELVSKFTEGAWLVVIVIPLLVLMFDRIHRTYDRIGELLELGQQPPPPQRMSSLVVVPVGGMSRLTAEAISAALSIGDEVIAVTVCYADPEDEQVDAHFREEWEAWHPNVPLVTLRTRAPLARPAGGEVPAPGRGRGPRTTGWWC